MDDAVSRRRFLAGVAGGTVVGFGIGSVVPGAVESTLDTAREPPTITAGDDPVPESDTPYAVFQYEPVDGGATFAATAPINVVLPLDEATFDEAIDVFRDARWSRRPAEYARYAYDSEAGTWHRSHWSGAQSVFGVVSRLHVRCWHLAGTASIQAHVDSHATPRHRIASYADAASAVAGLFGHAGWSIDPADPETLSLRNDRLPDHTGEAMVIRR